MLNGIPRILIIRLSAIGDVVRVLPALHALRQSHPNAQIDWIVESKSASILEGHPELDSVLTFDRPPVLKDAVRSFVNLLKSVRASRYDMVLDFHGLIKSGLIMGCSGAPERYGFAPPRAQELSWLFAKKRVHLESTRLNRIEENLLLSDAVARRRGSLDVSIGVPMEIQEEVEEFYEEAFHGAKRVVVMHVPVDRPEKQWPAEHFAALADLLIADGRYEVLLTWGPGQFEAVEAVTKRARRNPMVAPETPTLKHFAWLVHLADVFVGCDTGPMHIASAMGIPVVALFGGTDPVKHGPYREPCRVLYGDGPVEAWHPVDVAAAQARLRRITPEMAYDACVELIASR